MPYYTSIWQVMNGDTAVPIVFISKRDALGWVAKQASPDTYSIKKVSM